MGTWANSVALNKQIGFMKMVLEWNTFKCRGLTVEDNCCFISALKLQKYHYPSLGGVIPWIFTILKPKLTYEFLVQSRREENCESP